MLSNSSKESKSAIVDWQPGELIPAAAYRKLSKALHKTGYQVIAADLISPKCTRRFCPNCGSHHRVMIDLSRTRHATGTDPAFEFCLDCLSAVRLLPVYESAES